MHGFTIVIFDQNIFFKIELISLLLNFELFDIFFKSCMCVCLFVTNYQCLPYKTATKMMHSARHKDCKQVCVSNYCNVVATWMLIADGNN